MVLACRLNLLSLCSSYRISEVGAVLSWPDCTAEYPAERGSEGWRACGCHTSKISPSIRQRNFSLHSMRTSLLFSFVLHLATCLFSLLHCFEKHKHLHFCVASCLRLRECQLERIVQRRPEDQQVRCRMNVLVIWCASLSLCPFTLMWHGCFIHSSSSQRESTEEMDSTESPKHQTSAHVCYGQYMCVVYLHYVSLLCGVSPSHSLILSCCCFQKWHLSTQQSPYGSTPGPQSCKTNLQSRQEVRAGNHVSVEVLLKSVWKFNIKWTNIICVKI